jgi:hypothetical protein
MQQAILGKRSTEVITNLILESVVDIYHITIGDRYNEKIQIAITVSHRLIE